MTLKAIIHALMHSTPFISVALILLAATCARAQTPVSLGAPLPPSPPSAQAQALNDATISVGRSANQSVVGISVLPGKTALKRWEYYDEFMRRQGRTSRKEEYSKRRVSSGVLVSHDGYVITNHHVIDDTPEDSILVLLSNGETYRAELIGSDKSTDVAVLRVFGSNLPAAYIGNSDSVKVGEWVFAVGNPGELRSTMTSGIVSAIGRTIPKDADDDEHAIENFIQFDAAVNPGNSGGGLFDLQGRLIGIVSSLYSYTGYFTGYGFAIPSAVAQAVAEDIAEDGKVDRVWLGIAATDVVDTSARTLRLEKIAGVVVDEVDAGSPAATAGLRKSDVILTIDDNDVKVLGDLQRHLVSHRPGSDAVLGIWRNGREESVTVKLDRQPKRGNADTARVVRRGSIGVVVDDITADVARREKLSATSGIYVSKLDPFGSAARAGILQGDIIISIDDKSVPTVVVLSNEMRLRRPGDRIKLEIMRYGDRMEKQVMVERGW